jgi:hypothetical protein
LTVWRNTDEDDMKMYLAACSCCYFFLKQNDRRAACYINQEGIPGETKMVY